MEIFIGPRPCDSQLKLNGVEAYYLNYLIGITNEVGKDPGLPEALRARMLALEDEVNMVIGQYLGAVEGMNEHFSLVGGGRELSSCLVVQKSVVSPTLFYLLSLMRGCFLYFALGFPVIPYLWFRKGNGKRFRTPTEEHGKGLKGMIATRHTKTTT